MTTSILPVSPAAFARAKWEDVAAYFDELASRSLDEGNIEAWLQAWSTLEELVTEAAAQAMIAYTIDTSDPAKEADHLRFSTEIMPKMEERSVELARRLVASGYNTPTLATTLRRFRTAIEIFREENVPVFSELEELGARYQRITGSMTAEWEGEERPLPQLQPFLKDPDRAVRERAYRAATQPYMEERGALAGLFDRMYALRQQAARNAGFANYRDYIFPAKFRFDYTPADCERFHEAIERPRRPRSRACWSIAAGALGVDVLRPWDLAVDPGRAHAASPVSGFGRVHGHRRQGLRQRRRAARRAVPDDDGGAAARSREPQGKGARRILRDAPLPRAALHLHERRRPGGRCDDAAARSGSRLPRLCRARPAAHLAAAPGLGGRRAGVDVDGAAGGAASGQARRVLLARRTISGRGSSTSKTSC